MAIYTVSDGDEFKAANLQNWKGNSEFWLQGQMRHLRDIWQPIAICMRRLLHEVDALGSPTILDTGCGEGWLLRLLDSECLNAEYTGLDFNPRFIEALTSREHGGRRVRFVLHDLEVDLPEDLVSRASIVVNIFNLFELPNVEAAMCNFWRALRPGGRLLLVSIDPVMQMLAVTSTRDEFIDLLRRYEENQMHIGYDKDIDIGDCRSGRIYKSILYSAAYYVKVAKRSGLKLYDFQEVVKTANFVPQIYQMLLFRKDEE